MKQSQHQERRAASLQTGRRPDPRPLLAQLSSTKGFNYLHRAAEVPPAQGNPQLAASWQSWLHATTSSVRWGWGGRTGCSQHASTQAEALRTMPAVKGACVLPSLLAVLTLSSHPLWSTEGQHRCRVGCVLLRGQPETKAGRKELGLRLLLTQGWHSSFASWVPRRPGVSWRYILLRLVPNSYWPTEKKAGQRRKILPERKGKKGSECHSCHHGYTPQIFLLLNERTQKKM